MDLEARLNPNRFDKLDVDKFVRQQEAQGRGAPEGTAPPVSSSWLSLHVNLPSHLATLSMASILIFEVLVGVSMGVRSVRYVMAQWLMWLLLALNMGLLVGLVFVVLRARRDVSFRQLLNLGDEGGKAERLARGRREVIVE